MRYLLSLLLCLSALWPGVGSAQTKVDGYTFAPYGAGGCKAGGTYYTQCAPTMARDWLTACNNYLKSQNNYPNMNLDPHGWVTHTQITASTSTTATCQYWYTIDPPDASQHLQQGPWNYYGVNVPGYYDPPPPTCTAGQGGTAVFYGGDLDASGRTIPSTRPAWPSAVGGCTVSITEVVSCWTEPKSANPKASYCEYRYSNDGTVAPTGTSTAPSTQTKDADAKGSTTTQAVPGGSCPAGTVSMGSDSSGTPICGGTGSAPSPTPVTPKKELAPTTTNNADGSTTVSNVTQYTNADGSVTSVTQNVTTNPDGSKVTSQSTTTSKTPSGATGVPDKSVAAATTPNDFCAQNPNLTVCKPSSVSGDCDTLSAEGDAITASIARSAASIKCAQKQAESDLKAMPAYALGDAAMKGQDPNASTLPSKSNASSWAMPSSLDSSGWLGGGACFTDKSVTVQGRTIVLPFSKLCDYLLVFRGVIMIVALLIAFRMLSGTILLRSA